MADISQILEGVANLLWPAIILLLIFWFRPAVAALIDSAKSRKFTLKIGGQELTMEEANQQQSNLIADLQSQLLELRRKIEGGAQAAFPLAGEPSIGPSLRKGDILWVDDRPKNNSYLIQQLRGRGYSVDLARSTSEGLRLNDQSQYNFIISDLGRTEEGSYKPTAGLDLLKRIRAQNSDIPVVIFSSSRRLRDEEAAAKEMGVTAMTSSATELLGIIQMKVPR